MSIFTDSRGINETKCGPHIPQDLEAKMVLSKQESSAYFCVYGTYCQILYYFKFNLPSFGFPEGSVLTLDLKHLALYTL